MLHPVWSMALGSPSAAQVTQILRPASTVFADGWTPNGAPTLHECMNEVTPDDDTTYADSVGIADGTMQIGLDPGSAPLDLSAALVQMFIRHAQQGGPTNTVTLELREGTTFITDATFGTVNGWTDSTYTLDLAEKQAISNWANLRLYTTFGHTQIRELRVTQQYLRIVP